MKRCIDRGPWEVWQSDGDVYVVSNDFLHDVSLRIIGDFGPGERLAYAEWMCGILNEACPQPKDSRALDNLEFEL